MKIWSRFLDLAFHQRLLAVLLFICVLCVHWITWKINDWSSWYFLSLSAFLVFESFRRSPFKVPEFRKGDWLYFLPFILALLQLIFDPRTESLWLDEINQWFQSVPDRLKVSLVAGAAKEQQPPTYYYLLSFIDHFVGPSEFSLRLLSRLFHLWLMALVGVFCFTMRFHKIVVLFLCMIYFANPMLTMFASENRPYSFSNMLALLFLGQLVFGLRNHRLWGGGLRASMVMYLCSIGLQPGFVIFSLMVSAALSYNVKRTKQLFLNCLAVGLLFFPLTIEVWNRSVRDNKVQEGFHVSLSGIWQSFDYQTFFAYDYWSYFVGMFLIIVFLWWRGGFALRSYSKSGPIIKMTVIFSLLFAPLFYLFFKSMINWGFQEKYYLNFLVLWPLMMGFVLHELTESLKKMAGCWPALILLSCYMVGHTFHTANNDFRDASKIKWRELYHELTPKLTENDRAYLMTLSKINYWRLSYVVSADIYAGEKLHLYYQPVPYFSDSFSLPFVEIPNNTGDVYIIAPKGWSEDELPLEVIFNESVSSKLMGGERVFHIKRSENFNRDYRDFLTKVIEDYHSREWTYIFHELRILLSVHEKNFEQARNELQFMKESFIPDQEIYDPNGVVETPKAIHHKVIKFYGDVIDKGLAR